MTKNAAVTYAAENIRVNSVHPGLIRTPLVEGQSNEMNAGIIAQTPMGRMGTPEEVAYGCLFLASDESSFVTGSELIIDGGYLAQ
jgi:NAD(P)-dependent dehydrogenase (short-subunit alcohol dehydrogenase family)